MRLVLVGAPGAGKGTQAKYIGQHFDIPAISTGDIFRSNLAAKTPLGLEAKRFMDKGDLVPDKVTIGIVRDRLAQGDTEPGFLLDGFPRTLPQAEALDEMLEELGLPLDVVLELRADEDEVVRRLSGRRTCRKCGHVWHTEFDPPKQAGVCDICGGELFQRDDDKSDTVRHRLDVYAEQTAPLISFYAENGILLGIDATGPVDDVTERAIAALRPFE
jgi:adenylate kinase